MTWQALEEEWLSDSPWLSCHTSGSTGQPKPLLLPKTQVAASARRTIDFFKLGPGAHLHSALAPDYIGGKMMLIRAIICNGHFTFEKPSNRPMSDWHGNDVDLLCVVPSQLQYLVHNTASLPSIKNIIVGGSPVPPSLRNEVGNSGLQVWETYGMTETASHIAIRKVSKEPSPFQPLAGISVSSIDGKLSIDIPEWKTFNTNDVAKIFPDGSFMILGRADNVIITGGLKVHPEMVEAKLLSRLDFPVMISSELDDKWGHKVVLMVENPTIPIGDIDNLCRQLLPAHEVPKKIISGIIPRTSNGKIKR